MVKEPPELSLMKGVNRRILGRSFFLETLWNYEKMQNIGFLFCIYPALKRLYPDSEELGKAVSRHLGSVNTHPAMGPLLAGITARLEAEMDPSAVISYRQLVMAALAAQGDRIFWSHIRPLAAVCGVLLTLGFFGSLIGSATFLLLYNLPGLLIRITGFDRGWNHGIQFLNLFKSPILGAAVHGMRRSLAFGLGLTAGLLIFLATSPQETAEGVTIGRPMLVLCLAVFSVASVLLLRRETSPSAVIYLTAVVGAFVILVLNAAMGVR